MCLASQKQSNICFSNCYRSLMCFTYLRRDSCSIFWVSARRSCLFCIRTQVSNSVEWAVRYVDPTLYSPVILNPASIVPSTATTGNFKPVQIGYALAGSGALGTILSLALFPYLQRRFNNRRMYIFFSAFWALAFALMPAGHLAAMIPASLDGGTQRRDAFVWLAIALIMVPLRLGVNVSL